MTMSLIICHGYIVDRFAVANERRREQTDKITVAFGARMSIIAINNTPDAFRKICAPLGVTFCQKTPPTHPVGSAHQGGYLFLGGVDAVH